MMPSFEMTLPPQSQQPPQLFGGVFPRIVSSGDGVITNPMPGSSGAMLVVDTSGSAMAQLGLEQGNGGGGRRIRRFQQPSMGNQAPMFASAMPPASGGTPGQITINKLE